VTDLQLYFAIGLPTLTALLGIGVNVGYFVAMDG
jgi:hypothetical protein